MEQAGVERPGGVVSTEKVYGRFSIQEPDVRTGLNLLECMWSEVIL